MKIALFHNPNAFLGDTDASELRRVFERKGHEVIYVSTHEPNWQRVISPSVSRAVIVGGDGTVQLVAPYLKGTPFSILPFGTANNIAQCIHQTSSAELLASHLEESEVSSLDLGLVTHANERKSFLEASGMGIFAELILQMQQWPSKVEMERAESRREKFAHALERLQAMSANYSGMNWELKVDDTVMTDRFLLIAVMNVELIGPKLHLAPGADPSDGCLDLVCVREKNRQSLSRWLQEQSPGHINAANFERWRCRRVEARAGEAAAPVHIDSDLMKGPEFPILIEVEPAALAYAVVPH